MVEKRWNATDRLDQVRAGNVNIPRMHILGSRVAHLLFDNPAWHPSHEGISHECVPEIMDVQILGPCPTTSSTPCRLRYGLIRYNIVGQEDGSFGTVADHRSKYRDKLVLDGYTP